MRCMIVLGIGLACGSVHSQPNETQSSSFERITLVVGTTLPVADSYQSLWAVQPGAFVRVSTNVFGGQAHLAVQGYNNDNGPDPLPDFLALQAEAGWGYAIPLPSGSYLTSGAHLGALQFRFRENEQFREVQDETEVTAGVFARAGAPLFGPIEGFAEFHWTRVFTAEPIYITKAQLGLGLNFSSPKWLRQFLR